MSMKQRLEILENHINVEGGCPRLVIINFVDGRKGGDSEGVPGLAIVPGILGGKSGFSLSRDEIIDPDVFLDLAEQRAESFYDA